MLTTHNLIVFLVGFVFAMFGWPFLSSFLARLTGGTAGAV